MNRSVWSGTPLILRKSAVGLNNARKDAVLSGILDAWSREIDDANRLLYDVIGGKLFIYACRGHYDDK
jgi:hypothetical protein